MAKARNDAYYDDPTQLQPIDEVPGVPPGVAFTSRTYRYLAEPRFPEGIDFQPPGPFSILNDPGVDPLTGLEAKVIADVMKKYQDIRPQLADAALVYLAGRDGIDTIFTLDQRDFAVYRSARKRPFQIIPAV